MRISGRIGLAAATVALAATGAWAQDTQVNCIGDGSDYCNFVAAPGFAPDPLTSTGQSGGPVSTPDCGNIDTTPDHVLELTSDFGYLRAHVDTDADLTLVIEGPFGRVCNDDADGLSPAIERDFPAGSYQVWIGDWDGGAHGYTLNITEFPADGAGDGVQGAGVVCAGGQTMFCNFEIASGFLPDPMSNTGLSGGPVSTPDCGNIDTTPDHTITVLSDIGFLSASVASDADLTLVIEGPFGRICNDDAVGLSPAIERDFPAGDYQVWIGDFDGGEHEYTLNLSEFAVAGGGANGGAGVVGAGVVCPGGRTSFCNFEIAPGFTPDPLTNTGLSGGPNATADCGNIDTTPDHVIDVLADISYLRLHLDTDADLTLVVEGPFGRVCNDDAVGLSPEIARDFPAGSYEVYIGDWDGGEHEYTLNVTEFPQ